MTEWKFMKAAKEFYGEMRDFTEEERKMAKREQNKRYRTKKHEELVALRRAVNQLTNEKSSDSQTEQES